MFVLSTSGQLVLPQQCMAVIASTPSMASLTHATACSSEMDANGVPSRDMEGSSKNIMTLSLSFFSSLVCHLATMLTVFLTISEYDSS